MSYRIVGESASKVSKCCKYVYWAKIDGGNCCSFSSGLQRTKQNNCQTDNNLGKGEPICYPVPGYDEGCRDFSMGKPERDRERRMSDSIFRNSYQDVKMNDGRNACAWFFLELYIVVNRPRLMRSDDSGEIVWQ